VTPEVFLNLHQVLLSLHRVDTWRSGTFLEKCKHATDCNHRPWSDWEVDIRQSWRFRKPHHSCTEECAPPPHIYPSTSLHM